MSESIAIAHVSGPLGQALAVVDDETWLYEVGQARRRPTANDIRFFFDFGMEVRPVSLPAAIARGGAELAAVLDTETRRFRALRGLLVGMDPELNEDLQQRGMRRAEGLLNDPAIAAFIETRFLRPIEYQVWTVSHAVALARDAGLRRVERLYAIVDGPWLGDLEMEVREWVAEHQSISVERAVGVQRAYDSGLIATVAAASFDQDRARIQGLVFRAHAADWDPRLVAHLVNFAAPKQTVPVMASPEPDDAETPVRSANNPTERTRAIVREALEAHRSRRSEDTRRLHGGAANLDAVLKQVDWIVARFQAGNARVAWGAVGDLAQRQLGQVTPEYLAQSLTNIATQITGRLPDAEALLELAALCAPDDPTVPSANANLLMQSGRLPEALAAYDRTVEQFPDNVVARNGRAETLRALGRLTEALAAYESTVEQFPDNVVARTGRAETLRALGRLSEALATYDRTVEQFPDDVFARTGRAETLRALGRLTEALAAYDRTVEQFPDDVFARTGRAETLRALGRLTEALAAYESTVEQFPDNVVARNGRAETLRALGRLSEALATYDRTVEQFPDDVFARTGRAETLRALGRLTEALAAYDRTAERFPDDVVARNGRAETLRTLGRLTEALATYESTVERFPDDVVARNGRAETLRALGRLTEALAAYDRAVEQFPDDVFARTGLAETLRAMGRLTEALAAYDRTVEQFPDDVVARNGRAETLRALGRLTEALAAYDRAVEQFPDNVVVRSGRAMVLIGLGRADEARVSLAATGSDPQASGDWVAAHILCMIDLRAGTTAALANRLRELILVCPYPNQRRYFETTLAVVQLGLRSHGEARKEVAGLLARPDFEAGERQVLHLMQAHAEAADGDLDAARQSLATAANVVPYEAFATRQLRREIERRYGLGTDRALSRNDDIQASEATILRLEADVWVTRAAESAQVVRRAA